MNKRGPIVVIEDDPDDQHILGMIFEELHCSNEVIFFSDSDKALEYLERPETIPFIILSDINLPKTSGFELRNKMRGNEKLSLKCIPYIFFTTSASRDSVTKAYNMSIQGFFLKPTHYEAIRDTIRSILDYWQKCYSPTSDFGPWSS